MILSRLLYYKSDEPVSWLPRRKPPGPVFDNPELNRLVDENYAQVLLEGVGRETIPARLHPITRDVLTENGNYILDAHFPEVGETLEASIKQITGVLESGLFIGYSTEVLSC